AQAVAGLAGERRRGIRGTGLSGAIATDESPAPLAGMKPAPQTTARLVWGRVYPGQQGWERGIRRTFSPAGRHEAGPTGHRALLVWGRVYPGRQGWQRRSRRAFSPA